MAGTSSRRFWHLQRSPGSHDRGRNSCGYSYLFPCCAWGDDSQVLGITGIRTHCSGTQSAYDHLGSQYSLQLYGCSTKWPTLSLVWLAYKPPDDEARLLTPDELEFIVEESSEGGLLEDSDQLFFENILDLHDRTVEQVMTSRTRIVGIQADDVLAATLELACSSTKTRYPVFEEDLDNIIGIIHIKDIARNVNTVEQASTARELVRPIAFIPETLSLHSAVAQFRRENLQMAIVLDEYGGTAGIVTLEDLVEEVVGEIQDEFDTETSPIQVIDEHTLRVRGDVILDEVNQLHQTQLTHEDAQTIGGLAMAELGRIPEPGDQLTVDGIGLEVEKTKRFAVESMLIHLPKKDIAEDDQENDQS